MFTDFAKLIFCTISSYNILAVLIPFLSGLITITNEPLKADIRNLLRRYITKVSRREYILRKSAKLRG